MLYCFLDYLITSDKVLSEGFDKLQLLGFFFHKLASHNVQHCMILLDVCFSEKMLNIFKEYRNGQCNCNCGPVFGPEITV